MVDARSILDGLNEAQRAAVTTVLGPVAIIAGAGSGKTQVVSRRAAYAVATGAVPEGQILLVTFTEKAAREMADRLAGLDLGRVSARTFHSAALAQLRHFWPQRHDGGDPPEVIADKWRILAPLARALPGGYRFTPTKDLMDEIEWAKSRRLSPSTYEDGADGRTPPLPMNLFVRLFSDYERAKRRGGLIDFDDILSMTVELLEEDDAAAFAVRSRYSWFMVDEYQDTTPLQARLLELWLGTGQDLCVVGDEDQTIYTFAGATPDHLTRFGERYPGATVISLLSNYRSSPEVLALANKLLASAGTEKRLVATRGHGPEPVVRSLADGAAEVAFVVGRVKELLDLGVPADEIAVLVRLNAQVAAFEQGLAGAGIPYQLRGQRFFERGDVKIAIRAVQDLDEAAAGDELMAAVLDTWQERLGYRPDDEPEGREARERHAALSTLLGMARELTSAEGGQGRDVLMAGLWLRAEREAADDAGGVELLTLHRAKGLEWDAVFVPSLEEGLLPVSRAERDRGALAEERRLLYVGITRAREHLALTWAQQRESSSGRLQGRSMSRFLRALGLEGPAMSAGAAPGAARHLSGRGAARARLSEDDAELFDRLRAWRLERARRDKVSPFIVAYDRVLADVAERRPSSEAELQTIAGIGPGKVARYGDEILAIVRPDGGA